MHVIALGQMKGGCSKSSTAINLACQASAAGLKTALIDMDVEQGTSEKWGKRRDANSPLVEGCDTHHFEALIERLRADGFEWVFLDLPGRRAPVASMGMMAADLILIPCRPVDTDIEPSFNTVKAAVRADKRYCYLMGIAPPALDKRRARRVCDVLSNAGHPVCPVIIVQRLAVPDAISKGLGVNEHEPRGDAAQEFSELFNWLKGQMDERRKHNVSIGSKRRGSEKNRQAQGQKIRQT